MNVQLGTNFGSNWEKEKNGKKYETFQNASDPKNIFYRVRY
ncbi:hypothetical protein LEP1GSC191_1907 [Leptospira borgpetersenii serovar Mini str. 201000851]|uniref:Uncharacterized protein n=3 Tax=Leptospira borgpetersenii TaxID=174 RepID=A0A0S2IRX9_LEPBO|nr:hypothetical protein LBBP_02150 [Leptospira borgpetersenii serovar Ballum]EKP14278.1 hypothetical protein LEP1GSC128_2819 [Leptospira borgpetersenii str. 200801926]EKQ90720.1 hypothetical protein LEP1GSC101_0701 [Leptospira borgpetersenii str. UI 09149]EMK14794.1 hypothetical protein LEP1GSC066_0961 [Leptospira sp. serovar Kenya str. Sh9]EMN12120.1 hypothetical protein LEP1GSC055_2735 [Leptospira borgpetersenii str. Brem 307]EMN19064.1 hypothetical protein LEP1GSC056_1948 [Leptospira borgpe